MDKIDSLTDLLIEQLHELYDTVLQEQEELPYIQSYMQSSKLKTIVDEQLKNCVIQKILVEDIFKKMQTNIIAMPNECSSFMFNEMRSFVARSSVSEVRDIAIINCMQWLNQSKITAFGFVLAYIKTMEMDGIVHRVRKAIRDERNIDHQLTTIAEREINKMASLAEKVE